MTPANPLPPVSPASSPVQPAFQSPAQRPRLLTGLIGGGIQMSLSPALHEGEGNAHGLRCQYRVMDLDLLHKSADDLPELLRAAELTGFSGLNITHPCKQRVTKFLDELSPEAQALGAVNTVVLREGRRYGHNTDEWGYARGFQHGMGEVDLGHVVQLGSGGAGAAVAHAALRLGAGHLTIFDLDPSRAAELVSRLGPQFPDRQLEVGHDLSASMKEASGLIHATPTGMLAHPGLPLDPALLEARHWVSEVVYVPLETELLRVAREKGCRTLHGGYMTVFQAARAFELFSGRTPDLERMLGHFAQLIAAPTVSYGSLV